MVEKKKIEKSFFFDVRGKDIFKLLMIDLCILSPNYIETFNEI